MLTMRATVVVINVQHNIIFQELSAIDFQRKQHNTIIV